MGVCIYSIVDESYFFLLSILVSISLKKIFLKKKKSGGIFWVPSTSPLVMIGVFLSSGSIPDASLVHYSFAFKNLQNMKALFRETCSQVVLEHNQRAAQFFLFSSPRHGRIFWIQNRQVL